MTGKFLLCFFTLMTLIKVDAQQSKDHIFGIGYAIHSIQDVGFSPLIYSGQALSYGYTFEKDAENKSSSATFSIANADLSAKLKDENDYKMNVASRTRIQGSYGHLRKVITEDLDFSVGGALNGLFDYIPYAHPANNLVSYELDISIGPAIQAGFKFTDKIHLKSYASIPLLSYNVRSEDLGFFKMRNFEAEVIDILLDGQLTSLNQIIGLDTKTSFIWKIRNRPIHIFYHFQGRINKTSTRKGDSLNRIGVEFPITLQIKSS